MRNLPYITILIVFSLGFVACKNSSSDNSKKAIPKITKPTTAPIPTSSDALLSRFENEILRFDTLDQQNGLTKNGVLFTGSSSIRMWSSLEKDMGDFVPLNRGFGGATIPEVLHFMGKYIFRHEPQIIVFYCGENDISEGATPETVFASFKTFVKIIEAKLPKTKIVYIAMKPSLARWNLWEKYRQGDELIKKFIDKNPNIGFMDPAETMLQKDGKVKPDIFIEDGLHMNAKGYEGWTKQLYPILKKLYQNK